MRERSRTAVRAIVFAFGCLLALVTMRPASAEPMSGADQCAERESLVWALVEGYGDDSDETIGRYLDANFLLLRARADCEAGHYSLGIATYDRLIGNLTSGKRTTTARVVK